MAEKRMFKRMPAALKKLWVKALESGEYRQGKRYLKDEEDGETSYCCLGVLAEVAGARWQKQVGGEGRYLLGRGRGSGDAEAFLPSSYAKKYGLHQSLPPGVAKFNFGDTAIRALDVEMTGHGLQGLLADANDAEVSFKTIAAWIRKNL